MPIDRRATQPRDRSLTSGAPRARVGSPRWARAVELLQGRAAGKGAAVRHLRGARAWRPGRARSGVRRAGVALRGPSQLGLPRRPDGAGPCGEPHVRLAGGRVHDAPAPPGARAPRGRPQAPRPGTRPARKLRLAGATASGRAACRRRDYGEGDRCRGALGPRGARRQSPVGADDPPLDRRAAVAGGRRGRRRRAARQRSSPPSTGPPRPSCGERRRPRTSRASSS